MEMTFGSGCFGLLNRSTLKPRVAKATSEMKRKMSFPIFLLVAIGLPTLATSVDDVERILQTESFQIIPHVSDIPQSDLAKAGILRPDESLNQFMADLGRPFESGDYITGRLPQAQLLFAAQSKVYLLICYKRGAGRLSRNCVLIQRGDKLATIVFRAKFFPLLTKPPVVRANHGAASEIRNVDDLIHRLKEEESYQVLPTSSDLWFRKPAELH